jgi:hypothetical protein
MQKQEQIRLLEKIVDNSYRLLTSKLAHGSLTARNESAFQLEYGYILKTLEQLYEFRVVDKFALEFETYISLNETSMKSKSDRARVDILVKYKDDHSQAQAAIKLKFIKKETHREPNYRYDVFQDIANLELYKRHGIELCYFVLATDYIHYYNQENYSADTAAFDFRHNSTYKAGKVLQYKTSKPHGPDIVLEQDYTFTWNNIQDLYFLKLKI